MKDSRPSSLRTFLDQLRTSGNNSLRIIEEETDLDYEITAYSIITSGDNPALIFRNIKNYPGFSVVTNLLGSQDRIALATGYGDISEFYRRWDTILSRDEVFDAGTLEQNPPVKEMVWKGDDVDLFSLPIPRHYASDGSRTGFGRYITSGLAVTRDPRNEDILNLSFTRIQPFGKDRYAFDAGSHGNMWGYLDYCKRTGSKLEISIIIGAHPVFYLLGAAFTRNEYSKAKEIINAAYTGGITNNLPVPSQSEIVVEAEFLPDESFDEGPFAEYTGYMGQDSTRSVAHVRSIMSRKTPIYYDIQPSNSTEHINLFSMSRSAAITGSLRKFMPKGPDYRIHWPHYGSRFLGLGYVQDGNMSIARQFGTGIIGTDSLWGKIIFINDGKTELNLERALINLAQTDMSMGENVILFRNMYVISSDSTADSDGSVGKILFTTSGKTGTVTKRRHGDDIELISGNARVVISHCIHHDGNVNLAVSEDIEISDMEKVGWALATRMNPQYDVTINNGKISMTALRKHPDVPSIPIEVLNRIKEK